VLGEVRADFEDVGPKQWLAARDGDGDLPRVEVRDDGVEGAMMVSKAALISVVLSSSGSAVLGPQLVPQWRQLRLQAVVVSQNR